MKKRQAVRSLVNLICMGLLCSLSLSSNFRHEAATTSTGDSSQHTNNINRRTNKASFPSPAPLEFILWSTKALGISTILEVKTFEYVDHMGFLLSRHSSRDKDDDTKTVLSAEDLPRIQVRGLAATRDIEEGEVMIQIPFQALLSVSTTIDQDPILSSVMGPSARRANGWEPNNDVFPDQAFLEIPLLAIALLHHESLGSSSVLYPYIQLLETTSLERMPYLWNSSNVDNDLPDGIRTVAKGISDEVRELYELTVRKLMEYHPKIFGEPEKGEWFYSFENFKRAFALVNSRHWQLPIPDLERTRPPSSVDEGPPASTPTESWVEERSESDDSPSEKRNVPHSFLAPVADLINFGPPCTRSRYNAEDHVFELISSCQYKKGQEVTFYYGDECEDVMVGLYGFTHPDILPCPTTEEYRQQVEDWRLRVEELEKKLKETFEHLDRAEEDLKKLNDILDECNCCRYEDKLFPRSPRPRDDRLTERRNVRASWRNSRSRKLEF